MISYLAVIYTQSNVNFYKVFINGEKVAGCEIVCLTNPGLSRCLFFAISREVMAAGSL